MDLPADGAPRHVDAHEAHRVGDLAERELWMKCEWVSYRCELVKTLHEGVKMHHVRCEHVCDE